jgi:hypothetical protein
MNLRRLRRMITASAAVTAITVSFVAVEAPSADAVTVTNSAQGPNGPIAVIGDSLTAGLINDLGSRLGDAGFGGLRIDAVVSRRMTKSSSVSSGTSAIQAARSAGFDPTNWMIALGTNDFYESSSAMERMINEVLNEIGSGHTVTWVNIWMTAHTDESARFNTALARVDAQRSSLRVIDWASSARAHPNWFAGDGVHYTSDGLRNRNAALVRGALDLPTPPVPQPPSPVEPPTQLPSPAPVALEPLGPVLGYVPVGPVRVLDTRQLGSTSFGVGEVRRIDLSQVVPSDAHSAVVNLTAIGRGAAGFLSAWDCVGPEPTTSSVNHPASGPRAAAAVVALDAGVGFCIRSSALVEVLVDVFGAWTDGSPAGLSVGTPERVLDTRQYTRPEPLQAGEVVRVPVRALPNGQLPIAALINFTVTGAAGGGFVTAFPCAAGPPNVSSLNYVGGRDIANAAWVPTDATGAVCAVASSPIDLVADLIAVIGDSVGAARYQAVVPTRVSDTRSALGNFSGRVGPTERVGRTFTPESNVVGLLETVTVTAATSPGFVTVGPCTGALPSVSTLNYAKADDIANTTLVDVRADGLACHVASATTHLIVDITGRFIAS